MRPNRLIIPLCAALALTLPAAADAKNNRHKWPQHANAAAAGCPPGLAKKSPACVPPGLAKKQPYPYPTRSQDNVRFDYGYRVGSPLSGDYVLVTDPWRYGLDPAQSYARVGDMILHVDRNTLEVIAAVGLVSKLLN